LQFDSVTIVRHGANVADMYFNPLFPTGTPHMIHSCTKSIVSALIGIAIDAGHLDSVHIPVIDLLADAAPLHPDPRLRELTIEHLLTMQTGLRSHDSYLYRWRGLFELQAAREQVPPLSATARRVTGQTYALQPNPWRYDDLRLDFEPGADEQRSAAPLATAPTSATGSASTTSTA
jgi:CubicO group peptidase (beta-lactamase class C family)